MALLLAFVLMFTMLPMLPATAEEEASESDVIYFDVETSEDMAEGTVTFDEETSIVEVEGESPSIVETREDTVSFEATAGSDLTRREIEITGMDENGNIHSVEDVAGIVEENGISTFSSLPNAQVVNFNTKASGQNTEYTEVGTGISGYTNGRYGADAAYLGTSGGKVKFMLAGVIGLVNANEVQILNTAFAKSVSHYVVSGNRLIHNITVNMNNTSYGSSLDQGNAPSYLRTGQKYYSYDGHYFYTEGNYATMLSDYNANHRNNSVNRNNPYYNYFQYLPLRSQTNYSKAALTAMINNRVSANSKMRGIGNPLIDRQDQYGTHALLVAGIAANESNWGNSNLAQTRNNLFGLNARDASPTDAFRFSSVDACIQEFAERHISRQYLSPTDWKYSGAFLGSKASGMNVRYASDPYWGEKAANVAWILDRANGNRDAYKYTLGIKDPMSHMHTNLNVRQAATTTSTSLFMTGRHANQSFIILGESGSFYKIQSPPVLNSARSAINTASGVYNFNNMYAFVSKDFITRVASTPATYWSAESIATNIASPRLLGDRVQLTARIAGTTSGLQYKFVWMKDNWSKWGVVRDFSGSNTVTWTPPNEGGNYTLYMDVKDANGKTETITLNYQIKNWGFSNITTSPVAPQLRNTKITIRPQITGQTAGLQYKYVWMRNNSWATGNWGILSEFSTRNTQEWTPTALGNYQLYVDVRDSSGHVFTKNISYEIANKLWKYNEVKVDKKSPQVLGTELTISANISNPNSTLQYKYVWMKDNWKEWGVIEDFSSKTSVKFRPNTLGNYTFYVDVRDNQSNLETKTINYQMTQGTWNVTGIQTSRTTPQVAGTSITLQPTMTGNTYGMQYKFVWQRDNWNRWDVLRGFDSNQQATWQPTEPGNYILYIDVKAPNGTIRTITRHFEIRSWDITGIQTDRATPQNVGTAIKLSPQLAGNTTNLQFKYVWMKDGWKNWGVIRGFGTGREVTWKPTATGNYTLYIDVRDAGGNVKTITRSYVIR